MHKFQAAYFSQPVLALSVFYDINHISLEAWIYGSDKIRARPYLFDFGKVLNQEEMKWCLPFENWPECGQRVAS